MTEQPAPISIVPRFDELPPFDPSWLTERCTDGEIPDSEVSRIPGHIAPRFGEDPTKDPSFLDVWTDLSALAEGHETAPPGFPRPLLHRGTRLVIDGEIALHVMAAKFSVVPVRWFDGTEGEALALALGLDSRCSRRRNRADRMNAAREWLARHPESSDRSLAATCRVRPLSIAELRKELVAGSEIPATDCRDRSDGRSSPLPGMAAKKAEGWLRSHPADMDLADVNLSHKLGVDRAVIRNAKAKLRKEAAEAAETAEAAEAAETAGADTARPGGEPLPFGEATSADEPALEPAQGFLADVITASARLVDFYNALDPAVRDGWIYSASPAAIEEVVQLQMRVSAILRPARTSEHRRVS